MSPKQVKITPSSCAIAIASSTRPIGITQTGQPGPWTSSTFAGSRSSIRSIRIGTPLSEQVMQWPVWSSRQSIVTR